MAKKLYGKNYWASAAAQPKKKKRKSRYSHDQAATWWSGSGSYSDDDSNWLDRWSGGRSVWGDDTGGASTDVACMSYAARSTLPKKRKEAGLAAAQVVYANRNDIKQGKCPGLWPDLDARCHRAAGNLYSYDAALKDWASDCASKLKLRGSDAEDFMLGLTARAAIDSLSLDEWVSFAQFHLPEDEYGQHSDYHNQSGSNQSPQNNSAENELVRFTRDGRQNLEYDKNTQAREYRDWLLGTDGNKGTIFKRDNFQRHNAISHARQGFTPRLLERGNIVNTDDLSSAMMDARREILISDWSGGDFGPDAALWACGLPVSPLAEKEARLPRPMDILILVDGSGSTMGEMAETLSQMSFGFARSLRAAGHSAAVIPWGTGHCPISMRPGSMLWSDPEPTQIPCWEHSGTDLADAALVAEEAFAFRSKQNRRIALVLTDGACHGRSRQGLRFNFHADIVALWSFGEDPPEDWSEHKLYTTDHRNTMDDLRSSALVKALSAL